MFYNLREGMKARGSRIAGVQKQPGMTEKALDGELWNSS